MARPRAQLPSSENEGLSGRKVAWRSCRPRKDRDPSRETCPCIEIDLARLAIASFNALTLRYLTIVENAGKARAERTRFSAPLAITVHPRGTLAEWKTAGPLFDPSVEFNNSETDFLFLLIRTILLYVDIVGSIQLEFLACQEDGKKSLKNGNNRFLGAVKLTEKLVGYFFVHLL